MVLGHPERVVAALIHALGVLDDLVQRAAQFRLRIAALVDRGADVPQILHVDCAVIGAIEFRDHRVALADAGVDCHARRRFRLAEISRCCCRRRRGQRIGGYQVRARRSAKFRWLRSGSGQKSSSDRLMSASAYCEHSVAWRKLHRKAKEEERRADDAEAPRAIRYSSSAKTD